MGSGGGRKALADGIMVALAMAIMAAVALPVAAQTSNGGAAAESSEQYDIDAQPLARALPQWSAKSGIRVQTLPQAAERVMSAEVHGELSAIATLDTLLSGTGYTFRFSRVDAVVIEAVAPEAAGSIGTVRVQGTTVIATQGVNGSTDATATEGSDSYAADQTTVASKLPLAIKDTPQSVSVVTQQQLEDRDVTDLQRAITEAPGISTIYGNSGGANAGLSNLQPAFYSRGFLLQRLQVDGGAPIDITPNNPGSLVPQINMAAYDHIEILRGADGLLDGQGNPGGVINLTRKRPLDHVQLQIDQLFESYHGFNTMIDGTAPLAFDGRLKGRIVFNRQSNDYFYTTAKNRQTLVFATLEAQVTPTTVVAGGTNLQWQHAVPFYNGLIGGVENGQAVDLHLPRSSCFCFPYNRQDYTTREFFGRIEQSLGGDWTLKLNGNTVKQTSDYSYVGVIGTYGTVDPYGQPRLSDSYGHDVSTQYTADGALGGSFVLFGNKQEIVLGGNYSSFDGGGRTQYSPAYLFNAPAVDIFNFDSADYPAPARSYLPSGYTPVNRNTNLGVYGTFRFTPWKPLHFTYGLRYNRFTSKSDSYSICRSDFGCFDFTDGTFSEVNSGDIYSRQSTSSSVGKLFPAGYLAAMYDLTPTVTAYVSRTAIYIDNSHSADAQGNPLSPTNGSNYEGGVKYASVDHRLTASVAVFYVRQIGFPLALGPLVNPAANPFTGELPNGRLCCFLNDPNSRKISKGVDFEVAGELVPGLQASASYTYNQTRQYTSDPTGPVEPIDTQLPKDLYKVWLRYAFQPDSLLKGVYVGAGLLGQSSGAVYADVCNSVGQFGCNGTARYASRLSAYGIASLQAGYALGDKYSIGVTLNNLFDKRYYSSVGLTDGGNWYGAPRNFSIALRGTL